MTNLENIKNINVEELAYTMSLAITNCYYCPIFKFCKTHDSCKLDTCSDTWKKWFESDVKWFENEVKD